MPERAPNPDDRYFGRDHVTVIRPPRMIELVDLRELWAYRELLLTLAMRQIRVRYKQTLLGATWAIIQPVVQMLMFTIIFGRIAKIPSEGYPYPVYVYSALLGWNYFAAATGSAVGSLVANSHLVSKVYFPRLLIPVAAILAGLVDFALASTVMAALMLFYGVGFTANLLLVPVLVLALMLTAAGVGIALGALNVAFRDLGHAMPFIMQIWLYATPVVYPASSVPDSLRWVTQANPMTGLIGGFRSALLGQPFDAVAIMGSVATAGIVFFIGALYFHRLEREFADIV